jgi:hypothetical protein
MNENNADLINDKPGIEQIFAIIPLVGWIMGSVAKKKGYLNKAKRYFLLANIGFVLGLITRLSR